MADILRTFPKRDVVAVEVGDKVQKAVDLFRERGFSQLPVTDQGKIAGILTESDLLRVLISGEHDPKSTIAEVMVRKVSTIAPHADASELPRIFERGEVAIVVDEQKRILGIVTKLDLIEHLTRQPVAPAGRA